MLQPVNKFLLLCGCDMITDKYTTYPNTSHGSTHLDPKNYATVLDALMQVSFFRRDRLENIHSDIRTKHNRTQHIRTMGRVAQRGGPLHWEGFVHVEENRDEPADQGDDDADNVEEEEDEEQEAQSQELSDSQRTTLSDGEAAAESEAPAVTVDDSQPQYGSVWVRA